MKSTPLFHVHREVFGFAFDPIDTRKFGKIEIVLGYRSTSSGTSWKSRDTVSLKDKVRHSYIAV